MGNFLLVKRLYLKQDISANPTKWSNTLKDENIQNVDTFRKTTKVYLAIQNLI